MDDLVKKYNAISLQSNRLRVLGLKSLTDAEQEDKNFLDGEITLRNLFMSPTNRSLTENPIWFNLGQQYGKLNNSAFRLTKYLNKEGKITDEIRKRPNQLILRAWNTVQHEYKPYENELTKRVNPKTEEDRTIVRYLLIKGLRQCFEDGHLVSSPADATPVTEFETKALKFAWRLKLQSSNYYLEAEKSQYNEDEHKLHSLSSDDSNVIKYYTWPTLK